MQCVREPYRECQFTGSTMPIVGQRQGGHSLVVDDIQSWTKQRRDSLSLKNTSTACLLLLMHSFLTFGPAIVLQCLMSDLVVRAMAVEANLWYLCSAWCVRDRLTMDGRKTESYLKIKINDCDFAGPLKTSRQAEFRKILSYVTRTSRLFCRIHRDI
jgi:hypothetical protein